MGVDRKSDVYLLTTHGQGWTSTDTHALGSHPGKFISRGALVEVSDCTRDMRQQTSIQVLILDNSDRKTQMVPLVSNLKYVGKRGDPICQLLRGIANEEERYEQYDRGRIEELRHIKTGQCVIYIPRRDTELPAVVRYLGQSPEGGPGWIFGLEVTKNGWSEGFTNGTVRGREYFEIRCEKEKGVFCDMSHIRLRQSNCDKCNNHVTPSNSAFQTTTNNKSSNSHRAREAETDEEIKFLKKFRSIKDPDSVVWRDSVPPTPPAPPRSNRRRQPTTNTSNGSVGGGSGDCNRSGGLLPRHFNDDDGENEPFSWDPNPTHKKKYDQTKYDRRSTASIGSNSTRNNQRISPPPPVGNETVADNNELEKQLIRCRRAAVASSPTITGTSIGSVGSRQNYSQAVNRQGEPSVPTYASVSRRNLTSSPELFWDDSQSTVSSQCTSMGVTRDGGSSASSVARLLQNSNAPVQLRRRHPHQTEQHRQPLAVNTKSLQSSDDGRLSPLLSKLEGAVMEEQMERWRQGKRHSPARLSDDYSHASMASVEPSSETSESRYSRPGSAHDHHSHHYQQTRKDQPGCQSIINHQHQQGEPVQGFRTHTPPSQITPPVERPFRQRQQHQPAAYSPPYHSRNHSPLHSPAEDSDGGEVATWSEVLSRSSPVNLPRGGERFAGSPTENRHQEEEPQFDLLKDVESALLVEGSMVQLEQAGQPVFGVVRWRGSVGCDDDKWVGVELEDEVPGGGNGQLKGQTLFSCAQGKGVFVPLTRVRPDPRFAESVPVHESASQEFGGLDCPPLSGLLPPHPAVADVSNVVGRNRGIQGHQNSCYLDVTLFSMFAFTSVFDSLLYRRKNGDDIEQYEDVQKVLRENIVNPLRHRLFVRADRVMSLRALLDSLSNVSGLMDQEKDPDEFLNSLFQVLKAEPYLELSSKQTSYTYQLFLEKDPQLVVPTLQELFDQSFLSSRVKLAREPPVLILQMPRFGRQFKMYERVVPTQELDITDVIAGFPRQCVICGQMANWECAQCFGEHEQGLASTAFCNGCIAQSHKHTNRQQHNPSRLPRGQGVEEDTKLARIFMDLVAVICIETSHYVSFVRCGDSIRSPWVFFDSMADRKGEQNGFNIPEVSAAPEVESILSEEGSARLRQHPNLPLSGQAKRLICDSYICLYQSQKMRMYN